MGRKKGGMRSREQDIQMAGLRTTIRKTAVMLAVITGISGFGAGLAAPVWAAEVPPQIIAESGVLIDGNTGEVLWSKNPDIQLEPASTTKMITCLLALENLELNRVLTIDAETPFTEGSRIYLLEGENITVEHVLYALMLESANDAAVALAKEIAGSVEAFAVMMNERAAELGARNTNFINPNGLHLEGHVSTTYDLAMIARECMKNETFRTLCSTYYHYIPATNMQDERNMYNTNRLLYDEKTRVPVKGVEIPAKYEGAIGIKTGYTSHAGGCLVAGAERNGTFLIAVVLKSTDAGRFGDCIDMMNYGFDTHYSTHAVTAGTDMGSTKVKRGAVSEVKITTAGDAYVTLPAEASSDVINTRLVLNEEIKAPLEKGSKVGVVEVYEGDVLITTVDVITTEAVEEGTLLSIFGIEDKTAHTIYMAGGIIAGVLLLLFTICGILAYRKKKRRKALRAKRAMEIARAREERRRDTNNRDWHF